MADKDLSTVSIENNLIDVVRELRARIEALERKPVEVNELSEISADFGLVTGGEFRSHLDPQNPIEPGEGFSGLRIKAEGMDYTGIKVAIVTALRDIMGAGFTLDGTIYGAGGKVILNKDFLNLHGLDYAVLHSATYLCNNRYAYYGMWLPLGSSVPAWGIIYTSGVLGSNLFTYGDAEIGNLTGWIQSAASFSVDSTIYRGGLYSFKCAAIPLGGANETLTSQRYAASPSQNYQFDLLVKEDTVPASAITTIDIKAVDDTFVYSAAPNDNVEYLNRLDVGTSNGGVRPLIHIPLGGIAAGSNIISASLWMFKDYTYPGTATAMNLIPYRCTSDWVHNVVTWNTKPTIDTNGLGTINILPTEENGWKEIVLNPDKIEDMLTGGPFTNRGFMLMSDVEGLIGGSTSVTYPNFKLERIQYADFLYTRWLWDYTYTTKSQKSIVVNAHRFYSVETTTHKPYLHVTHGIIAATYKVQIKWYDQLAGGTLIKTDTLFIQSGNNEWMGKSKIVKSPTTALSYEMIITASVGNSFWIDDIVVKVSNVSQMLSITDSGVDVTNGLYPKRAIWYGDEIIAPATMVATITAVASAQPYGTFWAMTAANANNADPYTMSCVLEKGVYNIKILGITTTDAGKLDWYMDDVLLVSGQDWYSAAAVYNVEKTIDLRTISTSGYHVLKAVVNGKHASSTDFRFYVTRVSIKMSKDDGTIVPITVTLNPTHFNRLTKVLPTTVYSSPATTYIGETNNGVDYVERTIEYYAGLSDGTIPINAVISLVVLSHYATADFSDNARNMNVYRLLTDFVTTQATWDIRKTATNWATAGGFGAADCEQTHIGQKALTATETLNAWKDITLTAAKIQEITSLAVINYGLMLKMETELNDGYGYAGTGANGIKMVITYSVPEV